MAITGGYVLLRETTAVLGERNKNLYFGNKRLLVIIRDYNEKFNSSHVSLTGIDKIIRDVKGDGHGTFVKKDKKGVWIEAIEIVVQNKTHRVFFQVSQKRPIEVEQGASPKLPERIDATTPLVF